MATFCKTSLGGFNLDLVTDWLIGPDGECEIYFGSLESRVVLEADEAIRALAILESVCIFDATKETK